MIRRHPLSRRRFLKNAGLALPASLLLRSSARAEGVGRKPTTPARELAADVVIIGGGVGGCAAALAAARHGLRVIMTEETDWIGGQLTAQGVPPDENALVETVGATRSYQAFRQRVRDYYARNSGSARVGRGPARVAKVSERRHELASRVRPQGMRALRAGCALAAQRYSDYVPYH